VIAVVDYGASNVKSVLRAFQAVGAVAELTDAPDAVRRAARVVVPGVGHFAPARRRLDETGLGGALDEVARAGRPLLGICLGLQLLFDESEEAPGIPGLGLLAGWARVRLTGPGKAHRALARAFGGDAAFFYHVHSYHPDRVAPEGDLAEAEYGAPFPTIVGRDNVLGVQFHPEKSQAAGLALLREFAAWSP